MPELTHGFLGSSFLIRHAGIHSLRLYQAFFASGNFFPHKTTYVEEGYLKRYKLFLLLAVVDCSVFWRILFPIFQIVNSNVGPGSDLAQALWHSGDTTNKV